MKYRMRGFVSLLLALAFLVAVASGTILFVSPRGRVANWTGWTIAGLTKHEWIALHINACLLMLTAAVVHLVLNWSLFWGYLVKKSVGLHLKWEMAASVLLIGGLVAGTLYDVPPLTATVALSERAKDYWEGNSPAGPAPHAEEFTLERLARTVGLSADVLATALKEEGIAGEGENVTLAELAERNGMVPNQIYAVIRKRFPDAAAELPAGRGGGRGRATSHGETPDPSEDAAGGMSQDDRTWEPGQGRGMGMGRGMGGGRGPGWGRRMAEETAHNAAANETPPESEKPAPAAKEVPDK